MIDSHELQVGDLARWERDSRRFVVERVSMDYIHCRYLDTGETFHTGGSRGARMWEIDLDWWRTPAWG